MGIIELDADDVIEAIKAWVPGPVFSEARCRESLLGFLENQFGRKILGREIPVNRGRADIMITLQGVFGSLGAPVAIEMKYDLLSTSEYNRLLGQISGYIRAKVELIVVLCGSTKPGFLEGIAAHMTALSGAGRFSFKGYVIRKPVGQRSPNGRFLPVNGKALSDRVRAEP